MACCGRSSPSANPALRDALEAAGVHAFGHPPDLGKGEGETCNRIDGTGARCAGTMELPEPENCSCHISPPCSACVDREFTCATCGAVASDGE